MSYKNILIALCIFSGTLFPLHHSAASTYNSNTLTEKDRIVLILQLIEQVKKLQAQLKIALQNEQKNRTPITAADYTTGNPTARIQILTFSDFDCPFCKMFHTTLATLVAENPNVSVTYRHFPLEQLHPNAKTLAIAAECAGQIKGDVGFWQVVNAMFDSRSEYEKTDLDRIPSFITDSGISTSAFETCTKGTTAEGAVEADIADGTTRGVQGTPQSYVYKDGKLVEEISGAQPLETVLGLVTDLLK